MPIYEFECMKCGEGFEELFKSVSERRRPSCPQCSSKRVRKRFSVFSAGASKSGSASSSGSGCDTCPREDCAGRW